MPDEFATPAAIKRRKPAAARHNASISTAPAWVLLSSLEVFSI
jgi:hypothetical protein